MAGTGSIPLIKPMLAVKSDPFDSRDYIFEVKWDGYRALAYLDSGGTEIRSRNQISITSLFPELSGINSQVINLPALLDGEVVVFSEGRPSFGSLQARGRLTDKNKIATASKRFPALYVAFDILYVSGSPVMEETLERRKELLSRSVAEEPTILAVPEFVRGEGILMARAARDRGLEGVMAKALGSPYLPGKRSPYWKKIRHTKEADLVVCGYKAGKGGRKLGSLILCGFAGGSPFFAGKVGTGFSHETEEDIISRLGSRVVAVPPVAVPRGEEKGAIWVRPELVCSVEYLERTGDGYLRHPSFKGLRYDKDPRECLLPVD